MPLLNFKPRFAPPIRRGDKAHTIRADRKVPIKGGDKLYLYCGLRHPGAFRILPEPVICTKALPIRINHATSQNPGWDISIDGERLSPDERQRLARADGFESFADFAQFWMKEHGDASGDVRFSGQIIHWQPPKGDA